MGLVLAAQTGHFRRQRGRRAMANNAGSLSPRAARLRRHPGHWAEMLESRVLLSTVTWSTDASGNWEDSANWSSGDVPGPGDEVVISRPSANPTVTLSSGTQSVLRITSAEKLIISGASLTVTAGATVLSGSLTLDSAALAAEGLGVSLIANGATTINGSSLFAGGGGKLLFPAAT